MRTRSETRRAAWARLLLVGMLVMAMLAGVPAMALAEGGEAAPPLIDLTPVLQAVIGLLAAWITVKLTPWITARTTKQQQDLMLGTVKILVYAAEQIYGAGHGDDKLAYVVEQLKTKGYKVDINAIEATVKEMSQFAIVGELHAGTIEMATTIEV